MKYRPGIRSYFIITFVVVFGLSIYLINNYFVNQQERIKGSFNNIDAKPFVENLRLETAQDSVLATNLLNNINSLKALT